MSNHALFYNSVDHDRVYNADSFSDWLKKFFTNGVFTGDLFVSALSGMNVSVGTGYVNIGGKVMIYETATQLTLQPANGIYPRIDTIVVERNDTDRDFNLKVITGDYANLNNPVPTPPVRSGAIYQLVLAQVYVGAGVTEITQANITDTRPDDDLCGLVTGTVTEMDFTQFAAQFAAYYQEFKNGYELDFTNWSTQQRAAFDAWMADEQDDFDDWFANLHYILDGDVAGHLQNEIDALAAGMTGSIFEIQTSESTLIGKTVTVTGPTKTMTATISNAGTAEIRGFDEIGTITISATDGNETATSVISIPYFGNYPVTLAFWSATVNIQGDENIYGEDVLVSNSQHILVDTVTLSAVDGTGTFIATKADTYTFSVTYSGETFTKNLAVTEETTYSLSIETVPNGSIVTPTDVIQTWLKCARITDKSYTTLTEVLDDEETFDILLRDSNACDYIARSTTWASTICADADAMARVGKYDYCSCALLGNSTWASAIVQSAYVDNIIDTSVPTMTGYTTPSGEVSASSEYSGTSEYISWGAFNSSRTNGYCPDTSDASPWIQYDFGKKVQISRVDTKGVGASSSAVYTATLKGSNNGTDFTDIDSAINITFGGTSGTYTFGNGNAYRYYRLELISTTSGRYYDGYGFKLQFYGRHEAQTNIIHSAPQDTIYYMDNGDQVVLCTTDANGVGEVDWSDFDAGDITLYSSVAKDPDNLSNDYSKTIKITKSSFGGTTEAYLMPDTIRTLYWFGYNGGVVAQSTANGWSMQNTSWTVAAPTFNLNSITLSASTAQHSGIASENTILASKVMSISGARSGVDGGTALGILGTKVWAADLIANVVYDATNALIEVSNNTSRSGYIVIGSDNGRSRTCNALWYEKESVA